MKTQYTDEVTVMCKHQKLLPYSGPIQLTFLYAEKRANRDPDNIVFAKKFILDGMVNAGIIPNDTQKYIKRFTDEWVVGKEPGVTVIVEEWQDDRGHHTLGGSRTN